LFGDSSAREVRVETSGNADAPSATPSGTVGAGTVEEAVP
jgi:hypothetical protein